jgi:hypothetical protein
MDTADGTPRWTTKIAVLLREDLQPWQSLNVTAFLVSGVTATGPELVGEPYEDADGTGYLPMLRQPVLVLAGPGELLRTARTRAVDRGLTPAVFTAELFSTPGDEQNRAAVRRVPGADLDLVGIAVHGPRNAVDKVMKGARMHP